jgi:hypothetical protein
MFGFGKGKIEILLDNFNYNYGEVIEGKLVLKLKKPMMGKELSIALIGDRTTTSSSSGRNSTSRTRVFDFKQPIDYEKEYTNDNLEYIFKIKTPNPNEFRGTAPEGMLGTALRTAQFLSGKTTNIKWFLVARLSVKGFDVTKKIQVNIS